MVLINQTFETAHRAFLPHTKKSTIVSTVSLLVNKMALLTRTRERKDYRDKQLT